MRAGEGPGAGEDAEAGGGNGVREEDRAWERGVTREELGMDPSKGSGRGGGDMEEGARRRGEESDRRARGEEAKSGPVNGCMHGHHRHRYRCPPTTRGRPSSSTDSDTGAASLLAGGMQAWEASRWG